MSEDVLCPKCNELLYLPWSEFDYAPTFSVECKFCTTELTITAEPIVSYSAALEITDQDIAESAIPEPGR